MTLKEYLDRGVALGCLTRQLLNFLEAGIDLQDKQLMASAAARECDKPDGPFHIGYGGARCGGKNFWMFVQMLEDCLRVPGLKCLLLRKSAKANLEHFEHLRQKIFRNVPHKFA